jgi:hypothetical protein
VAWVRPAILITVKLISDAEVAEVPVFTSRPKCEQAVARLESPDMPGRLTASRGGPFLPGYSRRMIR